MQTSPGTGRGYVLTYFWRLPERNEVRFDFSLYGGKVWFILKREVIEMENNILINNRSRATIASTERRTMIRINPVRTGVQFSQIS
jgi:hypothetical protein